ncbi:MAG: ferrochelatase [Gammaproteobacteria bacterium]
MPETNKPASDPRALTGVLVTNLGTPDAPTAVALRRYLAEFLADPDVVTLPRFIWLPLLYGLVLPFRPKRSAEAYTRIWTPAGSPLLIHSRAIAAALSKILNTRVGRKVPLALGMRYGNPSLPEALIELAAEGVTRIVVLPLYPQYARATISSTVTRLKQLSTPTLSCIEGYCRHPAYIDALALNVRDNWEKHGRGRMLVISFHGIPKQVALKGDPYPEQCADTARLLAARLKLPDSEWQLTFQSRFGKAEWLQPYTDIRLQELAAAGMKTVDVVCPGFAADCLETLEEIGLRYAETFLQAGGERLRYIPALNDRPEHIQALAELVSAQLAV